MIIEQGDARSFGESAPIQEFWQQSKRTEHSGGEKKETEEMDRQMEIALHSRSTKHRCLSKSSSFFEETVVHVRLVMKRKEYDRSQMQSC